MYDKVYESQKDWSAEKNAGEIFVGYAKTLGLNTNQFAKDMASSGCKNGLMRMYKMQIPWESMRHRRFLNGEKDSKSGKF